MRRRRLVVLVVLVAMVLPLVVAALPVLGAVPPPSRDRLAPGDDGPAVRRLQLLLLSAGLPVEVTSVFDEQTTAAVRSAEERFGFSVDGIVDTDLLEVLSPVSDCTIGVVSALEPSQASVLGDALAEVTGCSSVTDLAAGRSLRHSWRCRASGSAAGLFAAAGLLEKGTRVCPASAVEVLRDWSEDGERFDVIVVDVAPAGAADLDALPGAWADAAAYAASPAVVFAATGDGALDGELRAWCETEPRCILAPHAATDRPRLLAAAAAAALAALPPQ